MENKSYCVMSDNYYELFTSLSEAFNFSKKIFKEDKYSFILVDEEFYNEENIYVDSVNLQFIKKPLTKLKT